MEIKKLYEEDDLLVISKPIGIAAHKGADKVSFTVSDWLVDEYEQIKKLNWQTKNRIGIVHRLDKDTSGVMILAKKPDMIKILQDQFRQREVEKHYLTLVYGKMPFEKGSISAQIYTNPKNRKGQKVELIDFGIYNFKRRFSATEYQEIKVYKYKKELLSLLEINLKTGRKHQIRAHMKFENRPVIGDQMYFNKPSKRLSKELQIQRQFLHSCYIKFKNRKGEEMVVRDELRDDLQEVLQKLEEV
ncbi:MAG: Ribosomal large subunit pseudouridine synthase D [candidate division WS2 bacterium ADurb.Bin280]|uniref:Ribosomal large subunit pseudouridine synthase D n=1 Tax=candidate division WS2 bacterium ADurb.Bin280 TaxID=1852829 RepID=A0A1V5SFI1_9BACT|nr:MAG: Ribosomal large subunit pseudouridine synthase D [candidate division WS2 bacterium ADurb.Bin280]